MISHRFYHWFSSLAGAIMIMVVMFYLQWIYAVITLAIVLSLFLYVTFFFKESHLWIDITQALTFRIGRACLLNISGHTKMDPKFWRPNLMLLSLESADEDASDPTELSEAIRLLDGVKHSGLLLVAHPILDDTLDLPKMQHHTARLQRAAAGTQAFTQVTVSQSVRLGCQNLLLATGLGQMSPNTLVAPLQVLNRVKADTGYPDPEEFVGILHDAKALHKNVVLTSSYFRSHEGSFIDCWVFGELSAPDDSYSSKHLDATSEEIQLSLMLQLGYLDVLSRRERAGLCGESPKFRLVQLAHGNDYNTLNRWLKRARIPNHEIKVVNPSPKASKVAYCGDWSWMADLGCVTAVRDHIQAVSGNSATGIYMLLNHPSATMSSPHEYMSQLSELTSGLPPCMMCFNGEDYPIIPNTI